MDQELRQELAPILDIEVRLREIKNSLGVIEWHVKVGLIYEYHCLRFRQKASELKIWTAVDTANELGLSKSGVSDDIRLAKELLTQPEVAKMGKVAALEWLRNK